MKIKFFKDNKKLDICLKIIFSIVIFVTSIRHIMEVYQPTLLDDEFSYWSVAAYFNNKDWSFVTSLCKYYSYGYSMILSLIMKITNDTVIMYRTAILLNGLFLVASFLILGKILASIFKDVSQIKIDEVAFISVMIPCYMSFATVNLTECLLLLLFLITIYLLILLKEKNTTICMILLGTVMGYSYMVHQRMICVIIAVGVYLCILFYKKEVNLKELIGMIIVLSAFLVMHHFIKQDIKDNLYLSSKMSTDNDYSSIFGNIKYICSSIKNLAVFVIGMAGKLFYFGTATYIVGFVIITKIGIIGIKGVKNSNEKKIYLPLFLGFALMIIISAVFMCHNEKLAWLLYGRYAEFLYPIIIAIGIFEIKNLIDNNLKSFIMYFTIATVIYGAIGLLIRWYSKRKALNWINYISCNQIYKYTQGDNLPIIKMMVIVFGVSLVLIAIGNIKKFNPFINVLVFVGAFILFLQTSEYGLNEVNLKLQNDKHQSNSCADAIALNKKEDTTVYYYYDENEDLESAQYREYVQYWLQDDTIKLVEKNDIASLKENDVLIISQKNHQKSVLENWNIIYRNSYCVIFCRN